MENQNSWQEIILNLNKECEEKTPRKDIQYETDNNTL